MVCRMDCEQYMLGKCFLKWLNDHNLIPSSSRVYLAYSQ